ncbi:MAG: response regulator transcription factor [Desulfobacterales bacterium]
MSLRDSLALRILIVEDNIDIAENISDYLELQGHVMDFAMDGISGLHLALTQDYDAIILDIMLPGMDGLTFCKKLREDGEKETPLLMLTARDTLSDKLKGFEAGADDYLIKPFEMKELSARIGALVRRSAHAKEKLLRVGNLEIDLGKMHVQRAGHSIELNRACLKILAILMKASPNVVSRKEIEHALWSDMPPDSDALRSHIYTLRKAIDKPFKRHLIQTVHGIGYKLVDPDDLST